MQGVDTGLLWALCARICTWDCDLWLQLWRTNTDEGSDKMALIKVIVDPPEMLLISPRAPMYSRSTLHTIMKNIYSSVVTNAI